MHNFVVAERQHVALGEGVEQSEGELAVMPMAMNRLTLEVLQRVVHPTHVPLVREAKATVMHRMRHLGPRC